RGEEIEGNVDVVRRIIGPCAEGKSAMTRMILRGLTAWALQGGKQDGDGYSQSQVRRLQSSVRSLMMGAIECGIVDYSNRVLPPLIDHGPPARNVRSPGRAVVMGMISRCQQRRDAKGRRDELALWLMFANALRVGEVCSVEFPNGVDLDNGTIWVRPKGHHDREEIELPKTTMAALDAYLTERGDEPGALFVSMDHRRCGKPEAITTEGMRHVVDDLGQQVGAYVRPHKLRHAGITEITRLTNANDLWVSILSRHRVYRGRDRMWQRYQDDPIYTMREAASIVQIGRPWRHPTER
ncbi:MAG: tyrosine-type recombinase/integrase, partial [Opitutaceae bacterium]